MNSELAPVKSSAPMVISDFTITGTENTAILAVVRKRATIPGKSNRKMQLNITIVTRNRRGKT